MYINMEMPKEIEPDLVIEFCEDLNGKRYARFYHYRYGGLTDWHEVLEVSEPHGRLISSDELIEFIENRYEITWKDDYEGGIKDACVDILEKISTMPTVIPASGEGET